MAKTPDGFVPLSSVRTPDRPAADIIADIRNLYFKTSAKTIEQDFAHAIALLMSLENEDARDKAAVYMEGLNEMRAEWAKQVKKQPTAGKSPTAKKKAAGAPAKPKPATPRKPPRR